MLSKTYYAQNYADIIGLGLLWSWCTLHIYSKHLGFDINCTCPIIGHIILPINRYRDFLNYIIFIYLYLLVECVNPLIMENPMF